MNIVPLAAAVAAAGLMIGCIELTGLSGKFTVLLFGLSGGDVVLSLILAAIILVLIGAGAPTTGVYIMGVALIAPIFVVKFGMPVLGVHMFMLFYACMSAVSPPIAVACFTAAAIAGVNPNKIAPLTTKLAIGGFILPFYFVFNPGLLMEGDAFQIVTDCLFAIVMMLAAIIAVHGWVLQRRVPWWLRLIMAGLAALIINSGSRGAISGGGGRDGAVRPALGFGPYGIAQDAGYRLAPCRRASLFEIARRRIRVPPERVGRRIRMQEA